MSGHTEQPGQTEVVAEVREPESARTGRTFSPVREEFAGRADASIDGCLRGLVAAGDARASNRAIGESLAIDESRVRALRKGAGHWMVGDLLALGDSPETRRAALQILDTLRSLIVEGAPCVHLSPEVRMLGVVTRTGELAAVVREAGADGEYDARERARMTAVALTAASELHEFARASMLPPPASGPRALKKTQMQIDTSALAGVVAGGRR